uniref:Ribonuclease H-like domain-containing protein n=1 Tax=Tanacetum cinerariifolium TaxID=118510 RepID=A0A6L2MFM3_TANCI|nr:ribonuclease H-like domain-containing protein [Tanacetum cinerariifolium]
MTIDETLPPSKTSPLVDDDLDEEEAIKVTEKKSLENDIVDETLEIDEIVNIKESRNHPLENGTGIEIVVYADSDHAGDYMDRKSTSGICTFVGCCLTSGFSKKQSALTISTTEAEYVSVEKALPRTIANADGTSTSTIPGLVTTEEKAQKKNDVKAKSMLLMALPNEHLLTFSQYKDAKSLFEAIQARFDGNDATKKTQKTLLKQMYENFNAPSKESLDSIFNMLQKIVSQLAILDLDIMSIDDLYKNFKIVEHEVKRTITPSSSSGSQNMAFLSSSGSTNKVDTANIQVSTISTLVSTVSSHDNTTNLSDATMYAFLANQPNGSQLVHEDLEQIYEDDLEEIDLKWQLALLSMKARRPRNQDSSRKTVNVEDISSKAMVVIDGVSFDWSYMADNEVPTNMDLMAFSDSKFQHLEFEGYGPKANKSVCVDTSNKIKKAPDAPIIKDWVSDSDEDESEVMVLKSDNVQHKHERANQPRKVSQNPKNNRTKFLPKSRIVPISTAKQSSSKAAAPVSVARPINTAAPKRMIIKNMMEDLLLLQTVLNETRDKKNNVLFTETECLILSSDFKLPDESQVLLKVPRKNNMYSFDLKNVVPSKGLTCLFAKATNDESNLWHRRLGHINFKTMNKLVKGNLFCGIKRIKREFSNAKTPQQNRVAKRKNMTLIEASRTMLEDLLLPIPFWAEAVNTACYVQNKVLVTKPHNKTPYELLIGISPIISFMRPFGCPVTILNTFDHLGKFDGKADEGFLVGYSINSKAFRVYNSRTRNVEKNLHVNFLENKPNVAGSGLEWLFDIDSLINLMNYQPISVGNRTNGNVGSKINSDVGQAGKDVKSASTPMETHKPLSKDADGTNVDVHLYRSMIGSLMYLTSSRPDIMFVVCACSRFQVQPKVSHMHVVKRIFRYLKGQPTLGLWYPKDSPLELKAYFDNDYAGASLDRKSTTGGCQFLGSRLISWQCKKQTIVTKIHVDNESAICVVNNHVYHSKTKHIEIRHHFIRDSYEKRLINDKKELAIPRQTTTGKEFANLLMAGSLPKTISAKSNDNTEFHKIVDFLPSCSITYALTAVVISESSVRSDLLFDDKDGITCLTNDEIFKNLALMRYEPLSTKLTFQKGTIGGTYAQTRSERLLEKPNEPPLSEGHTSGSEEGRMEHTVKLTDTVPPTPHDSPLTEGYTPESDVGRLRLDDLMDICIPFSNRVTTLENELSRTKDVYHKAFITLTKRLKKLETQLKQKRRKAVIHSLDEEEPSVDIEDSPKQGMMIEELGKDKNVNLASEQGEVKETTEPSKDDDDVTIAETLLNIKRRTTKDKGKGIMQETEIPKKIKKRELIQLSLNEELAQKLHAKELAKETASQEQEKYNLEKTLELQRQLDQRREDVTQEVMKRSGFHLQQESLKKQKLDEQIEEEVEAQTDSDQEVEEMKLYMRIVPDEEIAIDVIPLATKPPVIVEYKIVKEGKTSTYHIIRADESTKRYNSLINLLENIDREDFATLWKLVKDKHGNTRPEEVSVPSRGLYKTKPPSPKVIKTLIQVLRQGQETHTKNKKTIVVGENEILTREIQTHMKSWVDIIRKNAICLGGHKDYVSACLCHMLYYIETSTPHNLAFFILKRMEKTRFKLKNLLPYGMLLNRLFKHVVSVSPKLAFDHYLSHDRAMHLLAPHYERKTRADQGKERPRELNASSSSFTLNHPSSSQPLDDSIDENDDESFYSNPFSSF